MQTNLLAVAYFCGPMSGNISYTRFHRRSSVLLCLALFWMTICLPFVQQSQQHCVHIQISKPVSEDEDNTNPDPVSQPTEEKSGNSNSFSEEYIHHTTGVTELTGTVLQHAQPGNTPLFTAFYGECLVPPPDFC